MCRLFAFKSHQQARVAHWLVDAENSLAKQSNQHPDGWGLAYFQHGHPHVIKSLGPACENDMFQRVSNSVSADTVIAHIRRRTQGDISLLNCHPFQYGRWVMAHNGDLPGFLVIRDELKALIAPQFLTHIFGSTDSELYGALIVQELFERGLLNAPAPCGAKVVQAVKAVVATIEKLKQRHNLEEEASLNIILTNGDLLVAYRQGRELNYWAEFDETNRLMTLCVSSERITKDKPWIAVKERHFIAVDHERRFWSNEL